MGALLTGVDVLVAGRPAADSPPPGLGTRLRERCLTFCDTVHAHHANKTGRGFPLLEARYPGLGPVLARLREEHEVPAGLREGFQRTLARLEGGDPAEVGTEPHRPAGAMETHFDHEESRLVPALNAL